MLCLLPPSTRSLAHQALHQRLLGPNHHEFNALLTTEGDDLMAGQAQQGAAGAAGVRQAQQGAGERRRS